MALKLVYLAAAEADLGSLYDWVADQAGAKTAFAYIARIQAACRTLLDFPGRGTPQDGLSPGLRSIGFERRATIYYLVTNDAVEIVRVLRRGRDVQAAFEGS